MPCGRSLFCISLSSELTLAPSDVPQMVFETAISSRWNKKRGNSITSFSKIVSCI